MMFVLLSSYKTGATCEAGTAYPTGATRFVLLIR